MAAGTSRSLPLAQARKQGKVAARRADGRGRSLGGNLANRRYRRGTDLFRPGLTAGPPSPEGEGYFWTLYHLPDISEITSLNRQGGASDEKSFCQSTTLIKRYFLTAQATGQSYPVGPTQSGLTASQLPLTAPVSFADSPLKEGPERRIYAPKASLLEGGGPRSGSEGVRD